MGRRKPALFSARKSCPSSREANSHNYLQSLACNSVP